MANSPNAMARFCAGNACNNSACDNGIIGPATAPCAIRAAINIGKLCEIPHNQEHTTNSVADHKNTFTEPNWRASQPVKGIEIAFDTANMVITQVPWDVAAPKSPAIVGNATLAMVESSTIINTAIDKAKVTITSGKPDSGGISTGTPLGLLADTASDLGTSVVVGEIASATGHPYKLCWIVCWMICLAPDISGCAVITATGSLLLVAVPTCG